MLEIQTRRLSPEIAILEIVGKFTLGNDCKQLERTTETLLRENIRKIVIDLSRVTRIDSTGIGIMMLSSAHVKSAGGELRLAAAQGHVEHILKTTALHNIIGLYSTAEAAADFEKAQKAESGS